MAKVGDTFKSGDAAPEAGKYRFENHRRELPGSLAACGAKASDNEIAVAKGATLPNHTPCVRSAIWKLVSIGR